MPPSYDKQLLEKISQLTEENNKMLKALRSHSRWSTFFGFIKWAIILIPILWAYIYLKPYFSGTFKETTKTFIDQVKTIQGFSVGFDQLKEMQKNLDATKGTTP